jgi:adenylate cyclase
MAVQTPDQLLRSIAEEARTAVSADRCTIYELLRERNEVVGRAALGLPEGEEIRLPTTRGIIGFVARTGRSLRLRDVYNDPRFDSSVDQRTGYRTRSMVCVPVLDGDRNVLGAIQAINKHNGPFTEEDEQQLVRLCAQVATILRPV